MSVRDVIQAAAGGVTTEPLYSDSVFSTHLYAGNSSTQAINNGIDLAGKGGSVWAKSRNGAFDHVLSHTARGIIGNGTKQLVTNTTAAEVAIGNISVTNSGFQWNKNAGNETNNSSYIYVSWTFRNADKFYSHDVVTKSAGSNATVSFPGLGTLGMVRVKRTDSTGSWYVWHRSLSAGKLLIGESTAAEATLGHITVSGTTVTLVNGVIADGTYLVEAFAHDTTSDGLIQCGSFTAASLAEVIVSLGWEPQFLLVKNIGSSDNFYIVDCTRGWAVTSVGASNDQYLIANSTAAEGSGPFGGPTAQGFSIGPSGTDKWVYLAIRRPNKPPTTGTQVFNAVARTGTGAATTSTAGFPVDLVITKKRSSTTLTGAQWVDRLRGKTLAVASNNSTAEVTAANGITALDSMTTVSIGTDGSYNANTHTYVDWFFRRYPGVFDEVCYTGTGAATTIYHNLGVAPELVITKARNTAQNWSAATNFTDTSYLLLFPNLTNSAVTRTYVSGEITSKPSSSSFSVSAGSGEFNALNRTYISYLFATKAGISKVFSFTGNGTSLNIECGFSSGARFILLKRTDSTGDWLVADTTRGIVSAADPSLALNSTAAEVTTADWVDPYTGGFTVVQETTNNANVNNATYIGIAFS